MSPSTILRNNPLEKVNAKGNEIYKIDIFISDTKEGIIYSDGDKHLKGLLNDDKSNIEAQDMNTKGSVVIVNDYSSETILGNGLQAAAMRWIAGYLGLQHITLGG